MSFPKQTDRATVGKSTVALFSYLANVISQAFQSPLLVPLLLILANWTVINGTMVFHHDTGDGIAAFKFASFIPRVWNWFENAGQPFWHDLTIFRFHDPLIWPILLPLKTLPIEPYLAYTFFILIRIWSLSWGVTLLFKSLGFSPLLQRMGTFIVIFGSLGASVYEQWGMLDITFPFVFLLWALIRLVQTNEGKYLSIVGLILIHGIYNYHILLLGPIALVMTLSCAIFYRGGLLQLLFVLRRNFLRVFIVIVSVGLTAISAYLSAHQPDLTPVLRNVEYGSYVDIHGNNVENTVYRGVNIFNHSRLESGEIKCGVNTFCSEYDPDYLSVFVKLLPYDIHPWGESIGFIGRAALILVLLGFLYGRRPLSLIAMGVVISSYGLSLGSKFWAWPFAKTIFPILSFVRHTHFYLAIMVFALTVLSCLGLEVLCRWTQERKPFLKSHFVIAPIALLVYWIYSTTEHIPFFISPDFWPLVAVALGFVVLAALFFRGFYAAIIVVMIFEVLIFQFSFGAHYKRFAREVQREMINRPLSNVLMSRALRFYNPYPFPRSSLATTFGYPTAIEPVAKKIIQRSPKDEARFFDVRTIGYVNPFVLTYTLKARLALSEQGDGFKRAFGIEPYSILSILPEKREATAIGQGVPLKIEGNNLLAQFTVVKPSKIYLSLPHPFISRVYVNGKSVVFSSDYYFGLSFRLNPGQYDVEILPKMTGFRYIISLFYFGSFLGLMHFYLSFRKEGLFTLTCRQLFRRRSFWWLQIATG